MPPHKPVKTYMKKTRIHMNGSVQSVDAINALFAENLTKRYKSRKKKPLKLRELPPRTAPYVSDDSLKVEPNNTFDKLLKGGNYNDVKLCNLTKINNSNDNSSKTKSFVSTFYHSPVMTRSRSKKSSVVITEIGDKSSTLDKPVTSSLSIEKEKKGLTFSSLSYIKIPHIEKSNPVCKIFTETFRERQQIHSSTPCVAAPCKKIINDSISPITNSTKLIEKSYDQIRKWDEMFPTEETTPKRRSSGVDPKGRRRKLSISDWKLRCPPKVYLTRHQVSFREFTEKENARLVLKHQDSIRESVAQERRSSIDHEVSFRGFTEREQKSSIEQASFWGITEQEKSKSEIPNLRQSLVNEVTKKGKKSYVTERKMAKKKAKPKPKSKKKKKSRCIDVTEDILSEKEMSFDFSSDNRIQYSTEDLKQEKEIILPKLEEESNVITVDLQSFNEFVEKHYQPDQKIVEPPSIISVSDESSRVSRIDQSLNKQSLEFVISPKKSNVTPNSGQNSTKIVVLSDIKLGQDSPKEKLESIHHDHSYTALPDIIETSVITPQFKNPIRKLVPVNLRPGKSYRRSLSLLRRSAIMVDTGRNCPEDCVCLKCVFRRKLNPELSRRSYQIVPSTRDSMNQSVLEAYARRSSYVQEEDNFIDHLDERVRNISINGRSSIGRNLQEVTAKEIVLRRCGQTDVLPFEECYPAGSLQNCHKIGEGVYGEVFLYRNPNGGTSVMKIIPIEGDLIVNGERQKKFKEILSEIVISMELSNLRNNKKNQTTNFSEVQKIRCTQGNYPDRLIDLWDLYEETKGSENDSPQMFPSDQMYIVLELANGGQDLESFVFSNASQAFSMFKQTACALAVAETQLKFEHRDLHWGNVLISTVDKDKNLTFRLNGKEIPVKSSGIEVAIIDFTLSRIEFEGVVIYNDLSADEELFVAKGDYQFEIYRLMQKSNENEWQHFEPYTNVLWLHYLLDKVRQLRYKNKTSKTHKEFLAKLRKLQKEILEYNSVTDFVNDKFL